MVWWGWLAFVLMGCGLVGRSDGGTAGGAAAGGGSGTGGGSTTGGGDPGEGSGGGIALSWHFDAFDAGFSARFVSVHGRSATDFWVVSAEGSLYHCDGSSFVRVYSTAPLVAVAATPGAVFAASGNLLLACLSACDQ